MNTSIQSVINKALSVALVGIFALASVYTVCASEAHAMDNTDPYDLKPLFGKKSKIAKEARGVWQNLSYGWTLKLSSKKARLYHYSRAGCLKEDADTDDLRELMQFYQISDNKLIVSAQAEGSTIYAFQQVDDVPAECKSKPGDSPQEVFDYFYNLMDAHYAFFDVYGVDWQARRDQYAGSVSDDMSDKELFDVMVGMLEGLNDGHLVLHAEIDDESIEYEGSTSRVLSVALKKAFEAQSEIEDIGEFMTKWFFGSLKRFRNTVLDAEGQGKAGSGNMNWGRIGNIGYINVFGMGGFYDEEDGTLEDEIAAVHAAMDQALTDLQDTDALIFDVALNQGGLDEVSLALASHFTDNPVLGYTKVGYRSTIEPQKMYVLPAEHTRYLKPVTLFTSDLTVSAAEIFTMAMRSLPNVVHRGDTTWGALSDILSKPLPNGWMLELSNEIYEDHKGERWEGKGIPPVDQYTIFDPKNMNESHHNAILEIAEKMKRGK